MPEDEDSRARIRFAARLLFQSLRKAQPLTLNEIAQLRFLAISGEEREMPVEELARRVLEPESKRMGLN
jgi:hypothetical protein